VNEFLDTIQPIELDLAARRAYTRRQQDREHTEESAIMPEAYQRPEYICYRTAQPITLDGRLDEPAWQRAPEMHLVLADTGSTPRQPTLVRALWDETALYVSFFCQDTDIWGITRARDQDIYNQEVVEVFLDADSDERGYVEIEVSPLNAVLDLFMLRRRGGPGQPDLAKGLWDWDAPDLRTAVVVDGDPLRRGTPDRSWTVELALPWGNLITAPNLPPKGGDVWLANFYRIDRATDADEYTAWSPPGRINYHTPERFGRLRFSEQLV
jgi:hypothetical protein